jgi:hypothetical protein
MDLAGWIEGCKVADTTKRRDYIYTPNFIPHDEEGYKSRLISVDWLIYLCENIERPNLYSRSFQLDVGYQPNTFFMAVELLDRFHLLSPEKVKPNDLYKTKNDTIGIYTVACLMIAAKFHEVNPASVRELKDWMASTRSLAEVEMEILMHFEFDLYFDTYYDYWLLYLKKDVKKKIPLSEERKHVIEFLLYVAVLYPDNHLHPKPLVVDAIVELSAFILHGFAVPMQHLVIANDILIQVKKVMKITNLASDLKKIFSSPKRQNIVEKYFRSLV